MNSFWEAAKYLPDMQKIGMELFAETKQYCLHLQDNEEQSAHLMEQMELQKKQKIHPLF